MRWVDIWVDIWVDRWLIYGWILAWIDGKPIGTCEVGGSPELT